MKAAKKTTTTKATKKAAKTTTTKTAAAPKKTAKVAKEQVPASARVSRKDMIIDLISQPKGATLAAIMEATQWQAHSVRGMISILQSKGGIAIASSKNEAGERVYWAGNGAPKAAPKAAKVAKTAKTPKVAKKAKAATAPAVHEAPNGANVIA